MFFYNVGYVKLKSATKAIMSRSARVLMEGWVRGPGDSF